MSWVAVGAAAVTVVGGYISSKKGAGAAAKGAAAQQASSEAAIAEQRREYDQARTDQLPWLTAGTGALGQLGQLNSGNFSSFTQSPDYQFAYDQGLKTLDRSAAAHGRLNSGGYEQDLVKYGQGMATQNYNNYYNKIAGIAGVGQTASQNLGVLGANMADRIGQQYNTIGDAQQSSYANQSNIWNSYGQQAVGAINTAGTAYGRYRQGY